MNCDRAVDALHEGGNAPGLAEHLARCAGCRALAADLARLERAAAALPREIQPARDLWPGIAARIRPRRRAPWARLAVAAAALLLTAGATFALWPEPPPAEVAWTRELDEANVVLRAALAARSDLDPETRALVEANLAIIDRAVAETEAALAVSPDNRQLRRSLALIGERRVAVLQRVVALPTN